MAGPLAGLRVVEIGDASEVVGKLMADAGAEAIRVEPPGGGQSRHRGPFIGDRPDLEGSLRYAYLNTNKRSVVLDLTVPAGIDAWKRLVAWADVVIDGSGCDALDGLSAGYGAAANDRTIWCSITPFGLTGPWRNRRSNDLVSMALGGIAMMNGYDDHSLPPIRPDGDHSLFMGGEYAVMGIMAALRLRRTSGVGQLIDVSMHEAIAATTEGAYMNWEFMGRNPERKTGRHAGTPEEWQLQCSDGQYVVVFGGGIPRTKPELDQLLAWMDEFGAVGSLREPEFESVIYTSPMEGGELRARFAAQVTAFLASRPSEEVYRRGQGIGLAWGLVRRPEDNLDDPHWADRDLWVTVPVDGREVRIPRAGYRFTKSPVEMRRPAPTLGEANDQIP